MRRREILFVILSLIVIGFLYSFNESAKVSAGPLFQASPIVVTTSADSGTGSLRAAITAANQATAATTIQFNIPVAEIQGGVFTIKVLTALPSIQKDAITIDGTTQTAATGNTNTSGPEIVLDGSSASSGTNGIVISSNGNTIRGLTISNFVGGSGILITDASKNNTVAGCFLGTDFAGVGIAGNQNGIRINNGSGTNTIGGSMANANVISGNGMDGVVITGTGSDGNSVSSNFIGVDSTANRNQLPNFGNGVVISGGAKANVIGGAAAGLGNIISGNQGNGLLITGSATTGNLVQGNSIGTGAAATDPRSNGQSGISIMDGADTTTIGGMGAGNTIAFNVSNGISLGANAAATGVVRNRISRNSIFSNGGLGIDLGSNGVTSNDTDDNDNGPNTLLNTPVITSATVSAGTITVNGTIDTPTPANIVIEIFTNTMPNPGADPSGSGEGQTFATTVMATASGAFTASFSSQSNVAVTATATDANGNTSEFSPAFVLGSGQPDLTVTNLTVTPSSVNAGSMVMVQFTLRNDGTTSAASARNSIVLSADSIITIQDTVLGTAMSNSLSPGATQTFQVNVTVPAPAQGSTGMLFIGVIADSDNTVTESMENNNTASAQITIMSMPDLTVRNLTVNDTTVSPGDTVRVDFSVVNQGTFNAGQHVEEVRLSSDNIINGNDTLLTTVTSSGITAGSTAQFIIDVQIPNNTAPGRFFIGVITDARNTVTETNEANNQTSVSITVSGDIDFDLTNLNLTPNMGAPGSQVGLSVMLINRGSLPAPAIPIEFRLSTDQTINGSDPLLGTVTSSPLAAGQSATVTFNATIPAGTSTGRLFIGVIADPRGDVTESNENNNTISAAFTVADQKAPTVTVQSPNGGEAVIAGETFMIRFTSTDDVGVTTQDILLSTDSGATFNQVIITGLGGTVNSFLWNVPSGLNTANARVRVVARDAAGNTGNDDSNSNFSIGVRPILISPKFDNGKLKFVAAGSNVAAGAMLIVVNGAARESFVTGLNATGSKIVVKKATMSTPSGVTIRDVIPAGVTVQLIVRNPNGIESAPIAFQR